MLLRRPVRPIWVQSPPRLPRLPQSSAEVLALPVKTTPHQPPPPQQQTHHSCGSRAQLPCCLILPRHPIPPVPNLHETHRPHAGIADQARWLVNPSPHSPPPLPSNGPCPRAVSHNSPLEERSQMPSQNYLHAVLDLRAQGLLPETPHLNGRSHLD